MECNNCGKVLQEGENCLCSGETSAAVPEGSSGDEVNKGVMLAKPEENKGEGQEGNKINLAKDSGENSSANASSGAGTEPGENNSGLSGNNNAQGARGESFFSSEKTKEVINNTSNYLKDMLKFSKDFIKKPVISMKYYAVNHDFKKGLFFAVLQSLLFAVMILIMTSKTLNKGNSFFGLKIKIPYFKLFLQSLVFCFVSFLLIPVSHFITSKIFKFKTDIKALITISGISIIPTIIASLVLVVGMLITPYFSVLLTGAAIFSIILTYIGLSELVSENMEKVAYWIVTGYTLFPILLSLVLKIVNPFKSMLSSISIF